jgi:hypothetical protein
MSAYHHSPTPARAPSIWRRLFSDNLSLISRPIEFRGIAHIFNFVTSVFLFVDLRGFSMRKVLTVVLLAVLLVSGVWAYTSTEKMLAWLDVHDQSTRGAAP